MGVEAGAKAAIDLGTNTVLMVIGRKRADGSVWGWKRAKRPSPG